MLEGGVEKEIKSENINWSTTLCSVNSYDIYRHILYMHMFVHFSDMSDLLGFVLLA